MNDDQIAHARGRHTALVKSHDCANSFAKRCRIWCLLKPPTCPALLMPLTQSRGSWGND